MVNISQSMKKGMAPEWISCLDKRPSDRTGDDLDVIYSRLKDVKAFEKFHPLLLQQICYYGYYEDLEKGVTLFRQGDIGTNWYTVLSGCLDVNVSESGDPKNAMALCTLGTGTTFGETILTGKPHHATIVTRDYTELIRVEQRDFNILWERNKQLMEGVITPLSSLADSAKSLSTRETGRARKSSILNLENQPNPAAPITPIPSEKLIKAGHILRTILLTRAPHMIRDRKFHLRTYRRCMVATEMVEWLMQQSSLVHTRAQAVGMWQALLEDGVIVHVCHEHYFKDKYLFYRFLEDDQGVGTIPTTVDKKQCDDTLPDTLAHLAKIGPDAMLRMVLRKVGEERTQEELETIYEELLHIKALSHLSTMVKRELAHVMVFECHNDKGKILFNQGDEGKSWYIIQRGSVNVVIHGKGMVSTLHEGDDFGKLALVNDAPRAATIVLREDNCHFLRVDKEDFNRILRDVEANTVRLNEHGQDVLVLEKIPTNTQSRDGTIQSHYKYSVMAGTPEKMLEHLLETRLDSRSEETSDNFLEDFLLTHIIFLSATNLCQSLIKHYNADMTQGSNQERTDYTRVKKKSVIHFVKEWHSIARTTFREENVIGHFLEELWAAVAADSERLNLKEEEATLQRLLISRNRQSTKHKRKINSPHITLSGCGDRERIRKPIKDTDENIFKVYCADHTYTTLSLPMNTTVADIVTNAQDKLCLGDDLVLCEVKSNGDRVMYKENDLCVTTGLSLNGRVFLIPREHLDALTPLPEQEGPIEGTAAMFEEMSSRDVAYHMTLYDWELFMCVHEYELIYHVFGRHKFNKITANLDCLLRRFNEVQYWVVTEMLLTQTVGRRVQLLRKFIKLAAYCYEYQNLNSFFAIVMGLSNITVSRLSLTWEKLPSKFKRMFAEYETLMDPSRNHRVYRLSVAKMTPPIISFMPLLMKDMTFTHEGNKTYFDNLVNFEKMHMIAQTIRTVRYCRKKSLDIETPQSIKPFPDVHQYIRNLHVIDNQRVLAQLSHKLEPKRV